MKKELIVIAMLLIAFSAKANPGQTFYLQADMPPNSKPNDKTLWFSEPTGGVTMESLGAPAHGNRFDPNGFQFRTPPTSKMSTFNGTLAISEKGTKILMFWSAAWNVVGGFDVNGSMTVRPHRASVEMLISKLTMGKRGHLKLRTLRGGFDKQSMILDEFTGEGGIIQFGTMDYPNDVNGFWEVTFPVLGNAPFKGTVNLTRGTLSLTEESALPNAIFQLSPTEEIKVEMPKNLQVGTLLYGVRPIPDGTYTSEKINELLDGKRIFSGAGTLTIGAAK